MKKPDKEKICISMCDSLSARLSRYCFRADLPVSTVVSQAVKRFLASEMANDPAFWTEVYDKYEEDGKL